MIDINELAIIKKLKQYPFMNKVLSIFLKKDFMMFLVVGVINTLNGILLAYLYSILLSNLHVKLEIEFLTAENIAFALGYITALFISYLLNSLITFKEKLSLIRCLKFCLSYLPNFIIQNIIVYVIFNLLGWYKLIAYALAAVIGIPVTFLLMKFFAFGNGKKDTK